MTLTKELTLQKPQHGTAAYSCESFGSILCQEFVQDFLSFTPDKIRVTASTTRRHRCKVVWVKILGMHDSMWRWGKNGTHQSGIYWGAKRLLIQLIPKVMDNQWRRVYVTIKAM